MAITFIPNEVAIADLFHSPDGMVMRFLWERSAKVQDAAKAQIGGHGRWPDNSTGAFFVFLTPKDAIAMGKQISHQGSQAAIGLMLPPSVNGHG